MSALKNGLLVLVGVLIGLGAGWGIWGSHLLSTHNAAVTPQPPTILASTAPTPQANPATPSPVQQPPPIDFHAIQLAREKALRDHPELDAEYKSLLQEMADDRNELNTAMIKADPKVAPILAKLGQLQSPSIAH